MLSIQSYLNSINCRDSPTRTTCLSDWSCCACTHTVYHV